jgi:hypothetical protein
MEESMSRRVDVDRVLRYKVHPLAILFARCPTTLIRCFKRLKNFWARPAKVIRNDL